MAAVILQVRVEANSFLAALSMAFTLNHPLILTKPSDSKAFTPFPPD
jgi:hypothetical protein